MYISLAAALSQSFALARMRLVCVPDTSCTHLARMFWTRLADIPDKSRTRSGYVLHVFQMCGNVTLELSCTVFRCKYVAAMQWVW